MLQERSNGLTTLSFKKDMLQNIDVDEIIHVIFTKIIIIH